LKLPFLPLVLAVFIASYFSQMAREEVKWRAVVPQTDHILEMQSHPFLMTISSYIEKNANMSKKNKFHF
jgi:hypothetical protein